MHGSITHHQIFISYARDDDETFVKRLYEDLTARSIRVWWDRRAMESRGRSFLQELRDAIEEVDRVLFVVGPKGVASEYCRAELEHALLFAKGILPILRLGDYNLLPPELSKFDCPDFRQERPYAEALTELLNKLAEPVAPLGPLRNLVPALPPHFLPRRDEITWLAEAVLADVHRPTVITSAKQVVGLQGMGGIGKSVLAAAFARAAETRRALPDGIVWVAVGQRADPLQVMRQVGLALHDDPAKYTTSETAQAALPDLLADKAYLIVADDVWEIGTVTPLRDALGPRGRLLVTTRDAGIVVRLAAQELALDVLTDAQAWVLLAEWAGRTVDTLPDEAKEVAKECGNLPLALAMVGASVRGKPERWGNVLHRLRSAELDRIRQEFPHYPYHNLLRAIEVSLEALDPADPIESQARARYMDLAVFPNATAIPERTLAVYWEQDGLDEFDTQDVVDLFVERSLARRDKQGRLTLHDLQADYVKKQRTGGLKALHDQLLRAYAAHCPQGWSKGLDDGYFFQHLPYHLTEAGREEELHRLLVDFPWLHAKLAATDINALLTDYDLLPQDADLRLVRGALRLSAHILAQDQAQLRSQLWGRLPACAAPATQRLIEEARQWKDSPWLRPLTPTLTPPGGPLLRTLQGHTSGVTSVAVTPDGQQAISASYDQTLKIWDVASGTELRTLKGHTDTVRAVAVTLDGQRAISASDDKTLKVWDITNGSEVLTFYGHRDRVLAVAVTPDGQRAISASSEGTLKLWDITSGAELRAFYGHTKGVRAVTVTPDGKFALSASSDNTLKVWDLASGAELYMGRGNYNRTEKVVAAVVAVTPDGRHVISASDKTTIKVWDLVSGRDLLILQGHTDLINAVIVTADGRQVVSAADDATVRVWDLTSGAERHIFNHSRDVMAVAVTPDSRYIISASWENTLKIWDLTNEATRLAHPAHTRDVNAVVATPDGQHAISASSDATLKTWDLASGTELRTLQGHTSLVWAIAVTPDGRHVVSASWDHTLKVWDLASGTELHTLQGHTNVVNAVAVTPDGRYAISGSGHTLRDFDLPQRSELSTLPELANLATAMTAKSNETQELSTSKNSTLKVWDLASGRELYTLQGNKTAVNNVTITPDGQYSIFATGNILKIWDLVRKAERHVLQVHARDVTAVAVAPDSRRAISVAWDNTLKVWDLISGVTIASFSGESPLYACAISPDGLTFVAGEESGRVHFLRLHTSETTLQEQLESCRARHDANHAESRIMPSFSLQQRCHAVKAAHFRSFYSA